MLKGVDTFTLSLNSTVGAVCGGALGLFSTAIVMIIFSVVSTSRIANVYFGGLFALIGGITLYRIHRRQGMVSIDLGVKNDGISNMRDDEEAERVSLLSSEKLTYKGGVGADILHLPMAYKDSFFLPPTLNPIINEYIKQAEYCMAVGMVMSGVLTLILEKHNFRHLDDHYRVPIYMLLGSSMSFLIVYCIHDFAQFTKDLALFVRPNNEGLRLPAILTNFLYLTMIAMATVMGGGLGIVYGVNDIEGLFSQSLRLVFHETFHEILALTPIGLLIGICFGFLFGLLRALEIHHMPADAFAKPETDSQMQNNTNYQEAREPNR